MSRRARTAPQAGGFSGGSALRRLVWMPKACEPSSRFDPLERPRQGVSPKPMNNREMATDRAGAIAQFDALHEPVLRNDSCFYYASGAWSTPIDELKLRADAADAALVRRLSSCTPADLDAAHLLRWRLDPAAAARSRRQSRSQRRLGSASLVHAACSLPDAGDAYALLVLLTAGRGDAAVPTVEIVGDSLYRNVFATLIGLLRGAGSGPIFDRQSHNDLVYVVTPLGDFFGPATALERSAFRDALLWVHWTSLVGKAAPRGVVPQRPPPAARPSAALVGSSVNVDEGCETLDGFGPGVRSALEDLWDFIRSPEAPSTVIVRGAPEPVERHLRQGTLRALHSWLSHLYRGVVAEARRDRSAASSFFYLDDVALANGGSDSAVLHDELSPADGLHFSCVMRRPLPEPVGGWLFRRGRCRSWHDRGVVQLLIAMMVAGR